MSSLANDGKTKASSWAADRSRTLSLANDSFFIFPRGCETPTRNPVVGQQRKSGRKLSLANDETSILCLARNSVVHDLERGRKIPSLANDETSSPRLDLERGRKIPSLANDEISSPCLDLERGRKIPSLANDETSSPRLDLERRREIPSLANDEASSPRLDLERGQKNFPRRRGFEPPSLAFRRRRAASRLVTIYYTD